MAKPNSPALWKSLIPIPGPITHKYDRGCALIIGAPRMTGATRLAAQACARVGAGLVKVIAPSGTEDIYHTTLPAHIIVEEGGGFNALIAELRVSAILVGSGGGDVRAHVLKILQSGKPCVLDAAAVTAFESNPTELFSNLHEKCVLTPHEGEFQRIFPDLDGVEGTQRLENAAARAGCTVLLKGHDSMIACEGQETLVHDTPAPYLATAGTGDVLAGMITGLMAQGMTAFYSTAAAVYMHRMIGWSFGAGLVASDMPDRIPAVLKELGL